MKVALDQPSPATSIMHIHTHTHTHTHTANTDIHKHAHTNTQHILTQVKQDCGQDTWGDEGRVEEQVIASLQHQLEDMQRSLECLQQSDHNLRLSLRLAEHKVLETETLLSHANERCVVAVG